jgi:hypothetical protein
MEVFMITADIRANYKRSASEEQRFNTWLQGCVLIGSLLGAGLVAMAIAGLRAPQSEALFARTPSFQEQHGLAHLENLPVQSFEDMTLVFTADHSADPSPSVSSSDNKAKR